MKSIVSIACLSLFFSYFSKAQTHPDHAGLAAFYESTNGPFWANNQGWKTGVTNPNSNPCSGWHGVSCNSDNRVIKIDLRVNNLNGPLPEEMTSLIYLEELNFYYNSISGPFPVFLTELEYLKDIGFSSNSLEGPLPPEVGNFPSLLDLSLRSNNLSGTIPPELSQISTLEYLDLGRNQFEGTIPEELGDLSNLETLILRFNELEGEIPTALINLTKLRSIDISFNNYEGEIPAVFADMTSLITLSMGNNNFTGEIPQSLAQLIKLQNLNLDDNNLSGSLFDFIEQLPVIRNLRASNNNFSGSIPKNILDKTNLNVVDLSYNNFTGKIPASFGEASILNELMLNNNDFSGCIPTSYYAYCGDEDINFSNNPKMAWQGDMNDFCQTSGSAEEQIGVECNIFNLVAETISEDCECSLPCEHPDYMGLMSIYSNTYGSGWYKKNGWQDGASGNNCDPCTWYGVECNEDNRVTSIALNSNNLRGSLSDYIVQLSELQYLSLAGNEIWGQIPSSLFTMTQLIELNLGSNDFYGTIPENLGDMINLTELSFSNSNLTGSLPESIENLTNLTILNFGYNELSGSIPEGITNLTKLGYLSLDGNNLTGSLPEDIGNLQSLKSIRLQGNMLSGSVPASLGDLDSLFILYLHNNNLSGCFDPNLMNLCPIGQVRFTNNIDLSWGGEFERFCETTGSIEEQNGAFCGLGGSGIMNDCECIKSSEICYTPEGLLCKEWVQDLIEELECYDYGFGNRRNFNLAVSTYKEDPVLVAFLGAEVASEVVSTQNVYTCDGELLESCSYSLGTNCGDSVTIFSQLIPYPTVFYRCMEDELPDCSGAVQHPDFLTMVDLFYETGGLNWANPESWKHGVQDPFSNPCDGWLGVECDNNRVISITLQNNNLTGEIPSSISQLTMLQHLDLSSNNLSGDAIAKLEGLPYLSFLSLGDNDFEGIVPSSIGSMLNLTHLDLSKNNFFGEIPFEISQLPNLEYLRLNKNNFSGCIPSEFHLLCSIDISLLENFKLPWTGDMAQFCNTATGSPNDQFGAPCFDGDSTNGTNDIIQDDCSCESEVVSVQDPLEGKMSIYPNPVTNEIFIEGKPDGEISYRLVNTIGQIISSTTLTANRIGISHLKEGIYFLEISDKQTNQTEIFKIVKE